MNKEEETKKYGASNIQVLEGLEAVRKRPGMYIGSIGFRGLHHLIWEIVDNSVDEAMAGFATSIEIKLHPNNIIEVTDNGRGMPVDIHAKTKKSAVETILTVLHAGGKLGLIRHKTTGYTYGTYPRYGEINYQYLRSKYGYNLGLKRIECNLDINNIKSLECKK